MAELLGLGFRAAERRAETLPVGETGGATGVGGFAGNRLHGTRSVEEAGRKPPEGRQGQRPKHRAASAAHHDSSPLVFPVVMAEGRPGG
jgi:hypothetical protein